MQTDELPKINIKDNFVILAIFALGYVINYTFNIFLTHHFSEKVYGDVSVVMMGIYLMSPCILFGTHLASLYFLPEYLLLQKMDKFYGYWSWAMKLLVALSLLVCVIWISMLARAFFFENQSISVFLAGHPIIFSFWLVPLFALTSFYSYLLSSMYKQELSVSTSGIYPLISMIIMTAMVIFNIKLTIYSVFISIGISLLVVLLLQRYLIADILPDYKQGISLKDKKLWKNTSFQMMLNSLLNIGITAVNIFMLDILSKYGSDVGDFAALMTLMGVFLLVQSANNTVVSPVVRLFIKQENWHQLQGMLNHIFLFNIFIGSIILLVFVLFGKCILSLFGGGYIHLYGLLFFLSFTYFASLFSNIALTLLTYSKHQKEITKLILCRLLAIVVLNIFLIPRYQITGAVISLCLNLLIAQPVAIFLVRRFLPVKVLYLM